MTIDVNSLPVGGGLIVAGLLYAGLSAFVTGPLIGERTILKSGWDTRCRTELRSRISTEQPDPAFTPKLSCNSLIGQWFGKQGQAWCRQYGDRFTNPLAGQLQQHQRRLNALRQKRMALAASSAVSRCACAVSVTLEKRRMAFALYAGSARLITPPPVKSLHSELRSALHSNACAQKDR